MIVNAKFEGSDIAADHVITDPPYSRHTHGTGATMRGGKAGRNDFGFDALGIALQADIAESICAARSWSVVFTDDRSISSWVAAIESRGGRFVRSIPWVRWSMPQLSGDRPPQGWEPVLLFRGRASGRARWNGPGNLTHLDQKVMRGAGKHKTQKPLDLMLRLVSYFTEPDALILDPCAGRGTTVLAAQLLGRRAVGYEMDRVEAIKAAHRLRVGGTLDDHKRVQRWEELHEREQSDKARMRAVTKRARQRLDTRA